MVHIKRQHHGINKQNDTELLPDIYLPIIHSLPTHLRTVSTLFLLVSHNVKVLFEFTTHFVSYFRQTHFSSFHRALLCFFLRDFGCSHLQVFTYFSLGHLLQTVSNYSSFSFFSHCFYITSFIYSNFRQIDFCVFKLNLNLDLNLDLKFRICDNGRPGFYKQFTPVNY